MSEASGNLEWPSTVDSNIIRSGGAAIDISSDNGINLDIHTNNVDMDLDNVVEE